MLKSASQVVFVDGTMTPMRLRTVIGFAVGAPAQSSGARRSATAPARSLDLPSGRLRRAPAPDGRPQPPHAHSRPSCATIYATRKMTAIAILGEYTPTFA